MSWDSPKQSPRVSSLQTATRTLLRDIVCELWLLLRSDQRRDFRKFRQISPSNGGQTWSNLITIMSSVKDVRATMASIERFQREDMSPILTVHGRNLSENVKEARGAEGGMTMPEITPTDGAMVTQSSEIRHAKHAIVKRTGISSRDDRGEKYAAVFEVTTAMRQERVEIGHVLGTETGDTRTSHCFGAEHTRRLQDGVENLKSGAIHGHIVD